MLKRQHLYCYIFEPFLLLTLLGTVEGTDRHDTEGDDLIELTESDSLSDSQKSAHRSNQGGGINDRIKRCETHLTVVSDGVTDQGYHP